MYHNPIHACYTLKAATISTAANLLTIRGPAGKQGVLLGISVCVTTSTTDAATLISVGVAADTDEFGVISIPVVAAAVSASYNAATINAADDNLIPADTSIVIATNGGCTAGAADIAVLIAWI